MLYSMLEVEQLRSSGLALCYNCTSRKKSVSMQEGAQVVGAGKLTDHLLAVKYGAKITP